MKNIIVLLGMVSLVLCASDASNMGNQGTMYEDQLGALKESKLGRTILQMVSLASSHNVEFGSLFTAIDDLSESLKARKEEEVKSLGEAQIQYISDEEFYSTQVAQYSTEVAQHQVDLDGLKSSRVESQQSLQSSNAELAEAIQQQKQVEQLIKQTDASTTKKVQEYDQSILIIDQVIGKMQQIKGIYDQQLESSFLEVSAEDLQVATATMTRRLNNMSDKPIVFEPIAMVLNQMSAQKFADQEGVNNVIKLLNNLRDNLVSSKATLLNNAEVEKNDNTTLSETYGSKIVLLSETVIPELKDDIETKSGQMDTKKTLLDDASANLATAQANLDETKQIWATRVQQNKELNEKYDNELLVVSQALVALERGGIRR